MNKKNIIFIITYIFILISIILTSDVNAVTVNAVTDNSANISNGSGSVSLSEGLEITHELEKVEVLINKKSTTYKYNSSIQWCELNLTPAEFKYGTYTGNLAYEDVTKTVNNNIQKIENYLVVSDGSEKNAYVVPDADKLNIQVTYKIKLKNTSGDTITVKDIKYNYDSRYEEFKVLYANGSADINNLNLVMPAGAEEELEIKLKAPKNVTYKGVLVEEINYDIEKIDPSTNLPYTISYAEAPNALAPTLTIQVKPENRKISGYVWDDTQKNPDESYDFGNGICDEVNKGIKEVKVQLIEVRQEVDGNKYYIWQQTKTDKDGKYCFENIVPGNYIVRFIYGYRLSEISKTYNGQDYKSTKDLNYKQEWYNNYQDPAINNISVARDNEARRLETISNTAKISEGIGRALNTKNVYGVVNFRDDTYMYADTSKIYIAVASEDGKEIADSNIEIVNMKKDVSATNEPTLGIAPIYFSFENINFGLEERPKTEIKLEKHIKELVVTAGTVEILNTAEEQKEELETTDTSWIFKMDEEAQASGRIDVLYEYTIKNVGEKDYVSSTLADAFNTMPIETKLGVKGYKEFLNKTAGKVMDEIKANNYHNTIGTYLGRKYYEGNVISDDVEVATHVLKLEDYIDKRFIFIETNKTDFEETEEAKKAKQDETKLIVKNVELSNIVKNREKIKLLSNSNEKIQIALKTEFSAMQDLTYESYVTQIVEYANAVGRRDIKSVPGNLKDIKELVKNSKFNNEIEQDQYKAETIEIQDI